jgi:hypothetical protein
MAVAAATADGMAPSELDRWTQATGNDVLAVDAVVALPDGSGRMLVTLDGSKGAVRGQVGGWQPRATAAEAAPAAALTSDDAESAEENWAAEHASMYMVDSSAAEPCFGPLTLAGLGAGDVGKIWPGSTSAHASTMLLEAHRAIWLLSFPVLSGGSPTLTKLLDTPAGARELDATWSEARGGLVVVVIDDGEPTSTAEPVAVVFPTPAPAADTLAQLTCYTSRTGWITVASAVSTEAEALQISADGSRCAFKVFANSIPEESEAGEFWGADLQPGAGMRQFTQGAGRVEGAALSANGRYLLYQGNHQRLASDGGRPITTHLDLHLLDLSDAGAVGGREGKAHLLTKGGRHINAFGWRGLQGIWITFIDGVTLVTERHELKNLMLSRHLMSAAPKLILIGTSDHPATTKPALDTHTGELLAYGTESGEEYATLWLDFSGGTCLQLPGQAARAALYADLRVETIMYSALDETPLVGLLYEKLGTPVDAPLLVHAHGGPAIVSAKLRSSASNTTRYPFRHLLKAGYRVL